MENPQVFDHLVVYHSEDKDLADWYNEKHLCVPSEVCCWTSDAVRLGDNFKVEHVYFILHAHGACKVFDLEGAYDNDAFELAKRGRDSVS